MAQTLKYLALGDSYTIGELVSPTESFPAQVVELLNQDSAKFNPPRIIAKTGWTTDELEERIKNVSPPLQTTYDFVSLLIGVNNQYRGQSAREYQAGFERLLKKAILFAGNRPDHVIVLSIPDWGSTPFANGLDRDKIAREIDAFNNINRSVAEQYKVHYIDITPWTREAGKDRSLLTTDGLHPSGKEYLRWAVKIVSYIKLKR